MSLIPLTILAIVLILMLVTIGKLLYKLWGHMFGRSVPKILNLVANNKEYYSECYRGSEFMCIALSRALFRDTISRYEHTKAINAIKSYTKGRKTLVEALRVNKLPSSFSDRKRIYNDWVCRPTLEK